MHPVRAKCWFDLKSLSRRRRAMGGAASRAGAVRVADACKSVFFSRCRSSHCPVRQLTLRFCAALRDALVNNNENTSAKLSASGRAATQPAELPRENGAHRLVQCNTSGRRTSPATSAQQAGTRGRGTRAARQPRRAARGLIARHREPTGPARSGRPDDRLREAIQGLPARLWIASSPNGAPRGACAAGTPGRLAMTPLDLQPPSASAGPCKFLFLLHVRPPRARALHAPTGGSPRPAPALVNPCRSLLSAQIPGAAEPVRSGDRPVRRHGLSFPPPPPSAREESGERP
jgi:hypothetical protein